MNNVFNKISTKYPDIEIESLDYDFDDVEKYNVGEILPVLIKFDNDKEIDRIVGEKSLKEVEQFLKWVILWKKI